MMTIKCFISLAVAYRHSGFGSSIGEMNIKFFGDYLTSVMSVGNNIHDSHTNKTSRLVLTLKSIPSSPFQSISKHAK